MPFLIRKKRGRKCFEVVNANDPARKRAKCTTRKKAKAQLRILNQWMMSSRKEKKKKKISKKNDAT